MGIEQLYVFYEFIGRGCKHMGTARKNETQLHFFGLIFWVIPPIMVAAERDTPGIRARHLEKTIFRPGGK